MPWYTHYVKTHSKHYILYFCGVFPLNRSFFILPSFSHGLSIEIAVKCQAAFQVYTPNLLKEKPNNKTKQQKNQQILAI